MTIHKDSAGDRLSFEGRLEGVNLPDLIQAICVPRRTGILTFSRGQVSKSIHIKDGQLIFATSNVPEDRIGETLLRSGAIGYLQLERAVALLGSGRRLGAILVDHGDLTPPNLVRGLLHQVKEIILGLFSWESGTYRFEEGALSTAEVITLNISTSKLISDGIRRITSWPRIVRNVGRSPTIYKLTREGRLIAEDLDLGAPERLMLELLEKPTTVADLCRSVFLPNFDVYQYLWTFRILGIVERIEPETAAFDADTAHPAQWQGNLRDLSLGPLLLTVCRGDETGILFLSREGEERSIHVRRGIIVFATSSRIDDSLTTFLLRRGVIGLRDKEEIERRVLSNKRPGTILRELGILSQEELVRYVREQLREVVLSTFSWDQGEWRFVPGELPTFEDITLDRPVEELIFQGVRAVRNWARVRSGCGTPDTMLHKVGDGASLAPGVEPGPDEAEVLAALERPRSVASLCEATELLDYRVAQILWALQIVGRVERIRPGEQCEDRSQDAAARFPDARTVTDVSPMDGSNAPPEGSASEEGTAALAGGTMVPVDETTAPAGGTTAPSDGTAAFVDGTTAPADDTVPQVEETTAPSDGTAALVYGMTAPADDTVPQVEEATTPVDGTAALVYGTTDSGQGTSAPVSDGRDFQNEDPFRSVTDLEVPPTDSGQGHSPAETQKIEVEEVERLREAPWWFDSSPSETSFDGYSRDTLKEPPSAPDTHAPPGSQDSPPPSEVPGRDELARTRTDPADSIQPQGDAPSSRSGTANRLRAAFGYLRKQAKASGAGGFLRGLSRLSAAGSASSRDSSTRSSPPRAPGVERPPRETHARALEDESARGRIPSAVPQEAGASRHVPQADPDESPVERAFEDGHTTPVEPPSISPLEAVGTGVLEEIERFNCRHREVYAVLKGAVGAGARNFVGACVKRLFISSFAFADVEMDETGAFSPAALYERVGALTPPLIRERLESLIEAEADAARELLEPRTVQKMYRRLEAAISESASNAVR